MAKFAFPGTAASARAGLDVLPIRDVHMNWHDRWNANLIPVDYNDFLINGEQKTQPTALAAGLGD